MKKIKNDLLDKEKRLIVFYRGKQTTTKNVCPMNKLKLEKYRKNMRIF